MQMGGVFYMNLPFNLPLKMTDCIFANNSANGLGDAIYSSNFSQFWTIFQSNNLFSPCVISSNLDPEVNALIPDYCLRSLNSSTFTLASVPANLIVYYTLPDSETLFFFANDAQDKNPKNKEKAEAKFREISEAYEVKHGRCLSTMGGFFHTPHTFFLNVKMSAPFFRC